MGNTEKERGNRRGSRASVEVRSTRRRVVYYTPVVHHHFADLFGDLVRPALLSPPADCVMHVSDPHDSRALPSGLYRFEPVIRAS